MSTTNEIAHFTELEHIWWGAITPAGQKRYDNKVQELLRQCTNVNGKILEVGSGDGEFTKRLAKVVPIRTHITATDVTPEVIKRAKKNIKMRNIHFAVDDLEKMKYKNGSYNLVCGVSILHHVDTKKALKEIYRVLKKKGEMFFTEPNYLNPHVFLGLTIPAFRTKMEFSPDEVAFRRWELEKMIHEVGFKTVIVRNYDFLHPKTPKPLIGSVEKMGSVLEHIPFVKEISGSLIVYAQK